MGGSLLTGALAVGAAVLALWVDVRVTGLRPRSLGRRLAHACVAFLALNVATVVLDRLAQPDAATLQRELAVLLVFLPALVYAFLACAWLLRGLAEVVSVARH